MRTMLQLIDIVIAMLAATSAWYWWLASRQRLRRISRREELDAGDINRIVTALNRTQIMNARAAIYASAMAILAAVRMLLQAWLD